MKLPVVITELIANYCSHYPHLKWEHFERDIRAFIKERERRAFDLSRCFKPAENARWDYQEFEDYEKSEDYDTTA